MIQRLVFVIIISGYLVSCNSPKPNFLSSLNADGNTPLYTTYAAAMERSEFVLDEGYEFRYYLEDEGMDFATDTGGDLGIGFVIDGHWIYKRKDFFSKPVITHSYPDMVISQYYPVENLKIESTFIVESSSIAIHEISITNESDDEIKLDLVSFMRNEYRSFSNVEMLNDSTFYFTHEEYPDSWTVSHDVPFEDSIQNVFMISKRPDTYGSFNAMDSKTPSIPWSVFPDKKNMYELRGRSLINGERNPKGIPFTRFLAYVNRDNSMIITENSPVWGSLQGSINSDGYYRAELGNLKSHEGSNFHFLIFLEKEGLGTSLEGVVGEHQSLGGNLELLPYKGVPAVQNPRAKSENSVLRISWERGDNLQYSTRIYERIYPHESVYRLIAETDSDSFSVDLQRPEIRGYVLCHFDAQNQELGPNTEEFTTMDPVFFNDFIWNNESPAFTRNYAKYIAFRNRIELSAGESKKFRIIRKVARDSESVNDVLSESQKKFDLDLHPYLLANENLFSIVETPNGLDSDLEYLYWSSFNMMRQVFYPPEGKSDYNYYVFSREPTWGWGHGGQVFHESLTIPAYALLDPESAMNSQRVFSQRQYENGYINYRTGAYLDEIIEYNDQLTSSAPWYNYQNWELYLITQDRVFLEEMYKSGKKFYNFYVSNRDEDEDGLCEWGGHAILESVRDAYVAVWDEVGWPSNFEAVDLNCMLVMEAKSLEKMARKLSLEDEAEKWKQDWTERSRLINDVFWDKATGFYYHADKTDNDFSYQQSDDLKRQEIIGFLPLWAGVADKSQAAILIEKLKDPAKFWRKYGIPSLSADDGYYNDKGYWNGPVWVEWNYLIVKGLLDYGYVGEASALTRKVADGMIFQLKQNHNLWEFYSPDTTWAGYHKTYIWAGIINKMILDVQNKSNEPL